jgi:4-alpha-glucanotransferase
MGEIGPFARDFIRRLNAAGQHYWQVLPLGPTGYADSPYQTLSSFAGNAMLISFDDLIEDGLLQPGEIIDRPPFPEDRVDYGPVLTYRKQILDLVAGTFADRAGEDLLEAFEGFCAQQAEWLEDYALFVALKEEYDLRPWTEWPEEMVQREPADLKAFAASRPEALQRVRILQFLFDHQWNQLRNTAHAHGVKLIGDIPIFVAHDSAEVWANQELFSLDTSGHPTVVAGVPPDYFSATGQLWGNPLYRWEVHAETGYAWWLRRMRHMISQVDIVRIDHFRGFEAYWEVPASEDTAMNGTWVKGPGASFFRVMQEEFGDVPVIAEDLGVITPEVDRLRDSFDLPGMRILHFSFSDGLETRMRPEGFPENCIVYTGTHDNDTTQGWFWREAGGQTTETQEEIEAERQRVLDLVHTDGTQIHWDLISLAHQLAPHTAIVPLQDVMGLGSEARMNVPGRMEGNWAWRFRPSDLKAEDLQRLREITEWADRL